MGMMKVCGVCKENKLAEEFCRNSRASDGLNYCCRGCKKALRKKYNLATEQRNRDRPESERPKAKKCGKCKEVKSSSEFFVKLRVSDGLMWECKKCDLAKRDDYRRANLAKEHARIKKWKSQAMKNPSYRAQQRVKGRLYLARRIKDPGFLAKRREWARLWKARNPERYRFNHLAGSRRREARLAAAPGGKFDWDRPDYKARVELYGYQCGYCFERPATELDHMIPVSRGGGNWAANIMPACGPCNSRKNRKIYRKEWFPAPEALTNSTSNGTQLNSNSTEQDPSTNADRQAT